MKYPYIGKGIKRGTLVMMVKPECGLVIKSKTWATKDGEFEISIDESYVKNITREYLQNTYGEVLSPEHAEFIIELASQAGFFIACGYSSSIKFFCTNNESLVFCRVEQNAKRERKQITIPLPPKADSKKWTPDFYELGEPPKQFDCVCNKCGGKCCIGQCDKQESSEWTQVGDEVTLVSMGMAMYNKPVKLTYIGDGVGCYIDLTNSMEYTYAKRETVFKKQKTQEEELRDDIESIIFKRHAEMVTSIHVKNSLIAMSSSATEILLDEFEIKRKPH